jgi:hypothetical protein
MSSMDKSFTSGKMIEMLQKCPQVTFMDIFVRDIYQGAEDGIL